MAVDLTVGQVSGIIAAGAVIGTSDGATLCSTLAHTQPYSEARSTQPVCLLVRWHPPRTEQCGHYDRYCVVVHRSSPPLLLLAYNLRQRLRCFKWSPLSCPILSICWHSEYYNDFNCGHCHSSRPLRSRCPRCSGSRAISPPSGRGNLWEGDIETE